MKIYQIALGLLLVVSFTFTSCTKEEIGSICQEAVPATVQDFTGLDGCGLMLVLDKGERLEPVNEAITAFEDGDKVWVKYTVATDYVSICMVGTMVEIDCIEKR